MAAVWQNGGGGFCLLGTTWPTHQDVELKNASRELGYQAASFMDCELNLHHGVPNLVVVAALCGEM